MLSPANRMRRSADFSSVVRRGRRAGGPRLVVHHASSLTPADLAPRGSAPLVGFVVSRSVGGSVVRNRVTRRLRAQLADRLDLLPPGSATVVRALPKAATASSAQFGDDLDRALGRMAGSS